MANSSLPDSQDSVHTLASSTFSAPALPSSSSTLSTSDTDFTPPSTNAVSSQSKRTEPLISSMSRQAPAADTRVHASPTDTSAANAPQPHDTVAGPKLLPSPVTQGFKRKADGSLSGVGLGIQSPAAAPSAHKRTKSVDTHSGTRIGEVRGLNRVVVGTMANVYAAFCTVEDASFLCHGQGPERMGKTIT